MKKREFVKFYDKYVSRIYRFVRLKVNSSQDSEDLVSEAFFKFWGNINENKDKIDNPRALLYKIANNLVIDFYRKKSRTEVSLDPEDSVLAKIEAKANLSKKANLDADMVQIRKALKKLKNEHQDIIIWRYLDDFSVKEIAQITEKPEGTVRVQVHRALKSLKSKLSKERP